MRILSIQAFLLLVIYFPVKAEYRAFELVITDSLTGTERIEHSNLDPIQYKRFYPLGPGEKVTYRATWMCRGNTSQFKPICLNPKTTSP